MHAQVNGLQKLLAQYAAHQVGDNEHRGHDAGESLAALRHGV